MIICVDLGNTTTAFGVLDGLSVIGFWRIMTQERTSDEYGAIVKSLIEGCSQEIIPQRGAVCSVVPSETDEMADALSSTFGITVSMIDSKTDCGIRILTDNPAEVGADRIANAVGAYYEYGGPRIVVDAGTATTFDYVSVNGDYCGGVIAPGIMAGAKDLWSRARMLPAVQIRKPSKVIGKTTIECMQSGILYGSIAQVEGIISKMWQELGGECGVVVTGGQAEVIRDGLSLDVLYDPHLTLKGIAYALDPTLR